MTAKQTVTETAIEKARDDIVGTIGRYLDLKKQGAEYAASCPFHSEKSPSFKINPVKGIYHCFGCGEHGDPIDFVMRYEGVNFPEAVERIVGNTAISGNSPIPKPRKPPEQPLWRPIRTAPDSAESPSFSHSRLGKPSRTWVYHDVSGSLVGYVARFELGNGKKETLPMCWAVNTETGEQDWRWLSFGLPRPLYGADLLSARPKAPVLVVEGEKTADAARQLFTGFVVISWPGGGKAVDLADWSPLEGREVTLWPDWDWKNYPDKHEKAGQMMPEAEQPGVQAMLSVFAQIRETAKSARFVRPMAGCPDGWDLADAPPAEGFDPLQYAKANVLPAEEYFNPPKAEQPAAQPARAANDNTPAPQPQPMNIFAEFPAPPIDAGMLPRVIAEYAQECGDLIGVDQAMVAIPAIVSCAAALHDDIKIQPKRHETGWTESARLWCAIVGTPSVKKSPAIRRATKRLRKIDHDLAEDNARAAAEHAEQMEQFKDAKKEAKKNGGSITAPQKPMMHRMIVEDITVEALSEVLKDNSRGVMCIQDELSGWFGSMDAYSGGKAGNKDRAAWLQAYNGGFRQVDRVMRGAVHIPNFSVSMIGGIQPDAIRRIAKDMTDDGLMQRFMIVIGRNSTEHDRAEDAYVSRAFADLVDHMHAIQGSGNVVTLSEPAHVVRERLMAYAGELSDYPALPSGLRSHLGKWSGLFARLLLVYHAIECSGEKKHPCQRPVSGECAEQVENLMRRFLLPHALSYYTDILGESGDLEHARWIAGHILSKGLSVISNRDLMQSYKQWRGMDDWRRQRVMQVLEDMSWVFPFIEEGKPVSRRGATTWTVNDQVHELFAKKAKDEAQRRDKIRSEIAAMHRRD